ncbi:hypothetical protein JCM8547_006417 [Rhodosporidiobolus lusitaniae]
MQHPVQALVSTTTHFITASHTLLASFDAATNAPVATSTTAHKALVRLLATYEAEGKSYLVSTGEDKLLVVSSLPGLEKLSERELSKRANALEVTEGGEIVAGDKFGDVYIYPLHYTPPADAPAAPSSPTHVKGKPQKQHVKTKPPPTQEPILGHVSMLNALALIPASPEHGVTRALVATGDRDEHVRLSRFPEGHVIEGFCWGSKQFISSLLYLPPTPSTTPFLLSAGADSTIQVFALPSAHLVNQFPIEELLLPYIAVSPETPQLVPAGRKKDKFGTGGKGKGKAGAEAVQEGENGTEGDSTPAPEAEGEEKKEGGEEKDEEIIIVDAPVGGRQLTKGLAVIKMVEVGTTREDGGVVVLAAGSTALLYIPFSLLLPSLSSTSSTPATPSLLPFAHPILDFTPLPFPSAASSACEFLLSFDVSRSSPSAPAPSSSDLAPTPLARVSLDKSLNALRALPTLTTDSVLLSTASSVLPESVKAPTVASLYPVLSLLHHPGDEEYATPGGGDDFGSAEGGEVVRQLKGGKNVNSSRTRGKLQAGPANLPKHNSKGGKGKKRGGEDAGILQDADEGGRVGKRAYGRLETLRKYEEARRKLVEGEKEGKGEGEVGLTEGERRAVEEIEGEKRAEVEGAVVA